MHFEYIKPALNAAKTLNVQPKNLPPELDTLTSPLYS